jgi:N-acetylmuramoyl-L-alanine amidase
MNKHLFLVLFVTLLASPLVTVHAAATTTDTRAFPITITTAELKAKYQNALTTGEKVKILVMPGHEPDYGGAQYLDLKERDIAVDIANKLAEELKTDPHFEVMVARDKVSWNEALSTYFEKSWKGIQKFVKEKKKAMQKLVKSGEITVRDFDVEHNTAAPDSAYRLYGISKWANERDYDIVIHVHLNDNAGTQQQSGFAVYVPDHQFGNADVSKEVGQSIAFELNHFNASSTIPVENYAIVEDQELIALGSFNTAEFASVLVEYAYIYESKITHSETRSVVINDMAHQTFRGMEDFFGVPRGKDTLVLPFAWVPGPMKEGSSSPQVYALQVALHKLGFYPPAGQLLIGCPISGFVGTCTIDALNAFQKSKRYTPTGAIGPGTKAALQKAGF